MIPLSDDNPTRRVPFITMLLITLNVLAFGYQLAIPDYQINEFIQQWGFVPEKLSSGFLFSAIPTMFTSMFLHGGIIHLAGNMLYLWVFGDNIEDFFGHSGFLMFYLLVGAAGSFGQFVIHPESEIPMVGASGAIAGVMGAYMLLYPNARVLTAVLLIIVIRLMYLPAWMLLGFWILLQFLEGTASLGMPAGGGVAWFAHIGGFLMGGFFVFFAQFFKMRK